MQGVLFLHGPWSESDALFCYGVHGSEDKNVCTLRMSEVRLLGAPAGPSSGTYHLRKIISPGGGVFGPCESTLSKVGRVVGAIA